MAWKRWNRSLYVRPQAWWTPIGLLAVIGPSRKLHRGPPSFWARRRANVRRSAHSPSSACSWATKSGLAVTGWNIGPRLRAGQASDGWARGRRQGYGTLASRAAVPDRLFAMPPPASPDPGQRVSFRAMSQPQPPRPERTPRSPRQRSAFAAAFLSLLFPGLGHAYAGAPGRGLAFAALPLLGLALGGGIAIRAERTDLLAFFAQESVLQALFVVNVVLLIYRVIAAVDAWNVARFLNDADAGRVATTTP